MQIRIYSLVSEILSFIKIGKYTFYAGNTGFLHDSTNHSRP